MFNKTETKIKVTVSEEISNSNIIGTGTSFKGDVETIGNLRIEGKLIGNIKSKSKVACGKSSEIEGNIYSQNAEVAGHVKGTLVIAEMLVLKESALIEGDITTKKLLIETGAVFNGSCKMGVENKELKIETSKPVLKAQKG